MKSSKINTYLFIQIWKYFSLILFIFLSVAWLLQITRLFTITNFIHIQIYDIFILSLYLIPNIVAIITPFIIIFGLLLCFIKLNNYNELIAIYSLGLGLSPLKNTLMFFGLIIITIFTFLNFYLAPTIYKKYKIQEYELRNTLDFNNMLFSNFLNLDKNTVLDFKKKGNEYKDLFISFDDENENIVFAKTGKIFNKNNQYNFELTDGFKISIDKNKQIEKLEFLNYVLKIDNKNIIRKEITDKNTLTIFDNIENENYLYIVFSILDIILIIYVISLFFYNNLNKINFQIKNNVFFSLVCISVLIINQILKNSEIVLINYLFLMTITIFFSLIIFYINRRYE